MKEYNIEYVIDVLVKEEDRLLEKLLLNIPDDLMSDFEAYEAIRSSLIIHKEELNRLKG